MPGTDEDNGKGVERVRLMSLCSDWKGARQVSSEVAVQSQCW